MSTTAFSFTPVKFASIRQLCTAPLSYSVHKTTPNRVSIRIRADVVKKCGLKPGAKLAPFLDVANKAVLLLQDQRPEPASARKLVSSKGSPALTIEFPRADGFEQLFPGVTSARALTLVEASTNRIVFTVPKS